jgi:hypothetical protein
MATPVYRPNGVLAGTFGVGILTFLLLPTEVGYQDLAALIARDAAPGERAGVQRAAASTFGAVNPNSLNLPQPVGASTGYTLAGLDPHNVEITGAIRERLMRESAQLLASGQAAYPLIDRRGKGDRVPRAPRADEVVAVKGDRLDRGASAKEAQAESAPQPAVQVADTPPAAPVAAGSDSLPGAQPAPKSFALASVGDYQIGLSTKRFEVSSTPLESKPVATRRPQSNRAEKGDKAVARANAAADAFSGSASIETSFGFTATDSDLSLRTARLYFGVDPMGQTLAALEPWAPGAAPRLEGNVAIASVPEAPADQPLPARSASAPEQATPAEIGKPTIAPPRGEEVKLAALSSPADTAALAPPPAAKSAPAEAPELPPVAPGADQNVAKDPNGAGGQTVAPKGEVTGADKRPMSPAERMGLNDETSRAKQEKCLAEAI